MKVGYTIAGHPVDLLSSGTIFLYKGITSDCLSSPENCDENHEENKLVEMGTKRRADRFKTVAGSDFLEDDNLTSGFIFSTSLSDKYWAKCKCIRSYLWIPFFDFLLILTIL